MSNSVTKKDLIDKWRGELSGYIEDMTRFKNIRDPGEIIPMLSGMSSRASLFKFTIARDYSNEMTRFRHDELDPFLAEVKSQFDYWSRYHTVQKDEYDMVK